MKLSSFSIRRPITTVMIVLAIIVIGFVSSSRIPINLLPDITYPKVTIRTEYPHSAPEEVESLVTKPIEQVVGIINRVVKISSVSKPGVSEVVVEFSWGVDMDVAIMDIREKLQTLEGFLPEEIKAPVLLRYDPSTDPVITIGVAGELGLGELRYMVEREIEKELERIDGVAAVKLEGGYEEEIGIDLDEKKLARYGLSIQEVVSRLRQENINLAGGTLRERGEELAVRTVNEFSSLEDIKNLVIQRGAVSSGAIESGLNLSISGGGIGLASALGSFGGLAMLGGLLPSAKEVSQGPGLKVSVPIKLGDIANVYQRHKRRAEIVELNGKECVKVSIYKEGDANVVQVSKDVRKALKRIEENLRIALPSDEEINELSSFSRKFKRAVNFLGWLFLNFRPFQLKEWKPELVNKIQIEIISDQSVFINEALGSVLQAAIWGGLIAVIVLFFFLRNWGSTIIIGLSIPVSIIATFNCMYFMGISFNTMSLGGLALAVGILVDNSIVSLENILRNRTLVPDLRESAERGTEEVGTAITASTLTNLIVFFPILYVEGMFRQIFGDLAWTVAFGNIASLLVALSLVPMMSVYFGDSVRLPRELLEDYEIESHYASGKEDELKKTRRPVSLFPLPNFKDSKARHPFIVFAFFSYILRVVFHITVFLAMFSAYILSLAWSMVLFYPLKIFDLTFLRFKKRYPLWIGSSLKRARLVFAVSMLFIFLAVIVGFALGWELLPDVDQGEFHTSLKFPTGTPIEVSYERVKALEEKIKRMRDNDKIKNLFVTVGSGGAFGEAEGKKGENLVEMNFLIGSRRGRGITDNEMIQELRDIFSTEPEMKYRFFKPQLLSYKTPLEIEIVGYNLEDLKKASQLVMENIKEIEGITDLENSMEESNPEIAIIIDKEKISHLGLTVSQITDTLQQKVKGRVATNFKRQDRQLEVVVSAREEDKATVSDLGNLEFLVGAGRAIPLRAIADIKPSEGPGNITRVGNSRVALISGNISGRALGDVVEELEDELDSLMLPKGCYYRIAGQNEEMKRSLGSLYLALVLAVFLVYIVLASQFESLLHPFIIMFPVGFSLVGLSPIFFITSTSINVFSLIGTMMMLGMCVNDAIVMISTINLFRAKGLDKIEAIKTGASTRLRPMLITTLTTVFGMVPMALPFGEGYELRAPMAIAVIGGLSSATFFTLTIIPSIYYIVDGIGEKVRKVLKKE